MPVTTARVATPHAARYLQQLCKHWGHRFAVTIAPPDATISLPAGPLVLHAADDALLLRATVEAADQLEHVQAVVAEHLDRFAFREGPLVFDWVVAD